MTRQSFKKLAANLSILILLTACLLLASGPGQAWGFWGQSRKKTITKYEHRKMPLRFGQVKAAGKVLELKASQEPQESEEVFDADDDWMKDLAVTFKNTSGKNIVYFRLLLIFPETDWPGPLAFPMIYGRKPKDTEDRNFETVLEPGEEVELSLNDDGYGKMQNLLKARSFVKVSSVRLFLEEAAFDDDLMWNGGDMMRRDPSNPNQWLHIN